APGTAGRGSSESGPATAGGNRGPEAKPEYRDGGGQQGEGERERAEYVGMKRDQWTAQGVGKQASPPTGQELNPGGRCRDPADSAGHAKQRSLDQHLRGDAPARGAERLPHRDFGLPLPGARQQKVRGIDA